MVTTVGTETDIKSLVRDLIILEHDAIAAYETCIEHLDVLHEMARELSFDPPTSGDMKQVLTTGKVALAGLMGDATILKAMKTNEDDTVAAYRRAADHGDAVPKSKAFFASALADEERHRAWMDSTAASL